MLGTPTAIPRQLELKPGEVSLYSERSIFLQDRVPVSVQVTFYYSCSKLAPSDLIRSTLSPLCGECVASVCS